MRISHFTIVAGMLVAAVIGCGPSYQDQRPPLDELDKRDYGSLQSKDVLQASDQMAMSLLALPELNASREQWTLVVDKVEDNTSGNQFSGDYSIFIERLRTNLAKQGRGRIRLIENKARFYDLRGKELEGEREDNAKSTPTATQPDFALYGKAMDLPGRGTTYYNIQFDMVDLKSREQVWTDAYEVRVGRK